MVWGRPLWETNFIFSDFSRTNRLLIPTAHHQLSSEGSHAFLSMNICFHIRAPWTGPTLSEDLDSVFQRVRTDWLLTVNTGQFTEAQLIFTISTVECLHLWYKLLWKKMNILICIQNMFWKCLNVNYVCFLLSALLPGLLDVVLICCPGEDAQLAFSSRVGGHPLHLHLCHWENSRGVWNRGVSKAHFQDLLFKMIIFSPMRMRH